MLKTDMFDGMHLNVHLLCRETSISICGTLHAIAGVVIFHVNILADASRVQI